VSGGKCIVTVERWSRFTWVAIAQHRAEPQTWATGCASTRSGAIRVACRALGREIRRLAWKADVERIEVEL
jgi:hypothetical protein